MPRVSILPPVRSVTRPPTGGRWIYEGVNLPWPTIFTSITALVILRALGRRSLNEANITQIIMLAGFMVAGGLAFTIPGIWMLGLADHTSTGEMLFVVLAGTLLGLVCTALIRRRFVDESSLEYPIGTAAAETLTAATNRGGTGKRLFLSMGSGLGVVLKDILPALVRMARGGDAVGRGSVSSATSTEGGSARHGLFANLTGRFDASVLALMVAAAALVICFGLGLSPLVGAVIKLAFDRLAKCSASGERDEQETGIVVASGLLGGESIVGVIIALVSVATGLAA
ncbi:OPT/YSL family transporter [uncultured Parolsenella sp.]|uniref:OPT/YSL family transporter n=1 Tax=uncultured Parolsenella sp. TaxID=2083008 RepID=UPI0035A665EC